MVKRVIVVDDDKDIREIVTFEHKRNSFEVAVASNGQQLQQLLAEKLPEISQN
jgi:DNA-binding response OmpR family regulator